MRNTLLTAAALAMLAAPAMAGGQRNAPVVVNNFHGAGPAWHGGAARGWGGGGARWGYGGHIWPGYGPRWWGSCGWGCGTVIGLAGVLAATAAAGAVIATAPPVYAPPPWWAYQRPPVCNMWGQCW